MIARSLQALLTVYRLALSPFFQATGLGQCRYLPSCSEYAYVALARHGALQGSMLAMRRLSRCHPWSAGGLDPVPPAREPARRPPEAPTEPAGPFTRPSRSEPLP